MPIDEVLGNRIFFTPMLAGQEVDDLLHSGVPVRHSTPA